MEERSEISITDPAPLSSAAADAAADDSRSSRRREALVVAALLLILAVGAYFRFVGLNWDDEYHLHPDERFLTDTTSLLRLPENPLDYLRTSESPMNPYNVGKPLYVYGNFPMTVVRLAGELMNAVCGQLGDLCSYNFTYYNGVHLVGRVFSGLLDLVSIGFIFLIGRRLYDWRVGLVAALFQALAVMPIQQAHFYTMDNWAAGLTTVTLYMGVRAAEDGRRWRWWGLFGLFLGLTVASRINMAPLAAIAVVAGVVWTARRGVGEKSILEWPQLPAVQQAVLGVTLAAIVSMVTVRVAQPYAFADAGVVRETAVAETGREPGLISTAIGSVVGLNPQWLGNMEEIQRLQSPDASFPPALQWTDRTKALFPLTNMILYGMGITASVLSFFGLGWALWRTVRLREDWLAHALPVAWVLLYFGFMGTRWVQSIRYFLPLYPFLFLLGAWALIRLWDRARSSAARRVAVGALAGVAILPSLLWANAFVQIYQEPVTRVAASRWMIENIPSAVTVLYDDGAGNQQAYHLPSRGLFLGSDQAPTVLTIQLPEPGTVTAVRFNYLRDPQGDGDRETIYANLDVQPILAEGTVTVNVGAEREEVTVPLSEGVPLSENQTARLSLFSGDGGSLEATTSIIANEHWDDPLPVRVDGLDPFGQFFTGWSGGQLPVTGPDNPEKMTQIVSWLDEADVVVLSSQRALWSLPRLPLTYPLMMEYYQGLFDGSLGFELVAEFHADLNVGPLYISDTGGELDWGVPPQIGWPPPGKTAAEEAFSVYDHPPVWIFQKQEDFDLARVERTLAQADLTTQTTMNPGEATQAVNGLQLSEKSEEIQQANGTFSRVFDVDGVLSQNPGLAAVVWWAAVLAMGWLAVPLAYAVFRGLPSRGYALARILAPLLVSYFAWLMGSVGWLPHTRGTLLLGTALLAGLSATVARRRGREIWAFIRRNVAYIGVVEAIALGLYLLLIVVRLGNPDVWDVIWGGEKPMDLAYFTAVLKSTTFPPYDPWYAGGYINYYYYGFVFVGALTKLLGIVPAVAYNLILPMLFSFTGTAAFALSYDLVAARRGDDTPLFDRRPLLAGGAALALSVLLGNLAQPGVILNAWYRTGSGAISTGVGALDAVLRTVDGAIKIIFQGVPAAVYPSDWFWNATRTLNFNPGEAQPITEFPYFTFLYGDLHAHMISLPLMLLALGWGLSLVLGGQRAERAFRWERLWIWLVGGIGIGVLRATNTWDWPTYVVLGALAIFGANYYRMRKVDVRYFLQSGAQALGLALLATVTFLPFAENYGQGYSSVNLWPGSYTFLRNYLVVYGLFLFVIVSYLAWEFRAWTRTWRREWLEKNETAGWLFVAGAILFVGVVFSMVLRGYWIAPVVLTLVVIAGLLGLRPGLSPARRSGLILISASLFLTLAVEIVVITGDVGRMNMVFKFYNQVWLILSVVAGAALAWIWPAIGNRAVLPRRLWRGALGLLAAIAFLYPLVATPAKWSIRMSDEAPTSLDGMAFMETTTYQDSGATVQLEKDYEAIQWLQRNVQGSPVIAEAHSDNPYRSMANRVANFTGLPAIVGWDWHQRQQRATVPGRLVTARIQDNNRLFNSADVGEKLAIIDKYDVEYIYSGTLEWIYYSPEGLVLFDEMVDAGFLEEVFRNSHVTIYQVNRQMVAGGATPPVNGQ